MAPGKVTDYERKRLDNIRRNDEMRAALKLHSKATQLSNFKRSQTQSQRVRTKSYILKLEKKYKPKTLIVSRRSLRTRGISPDSVGPTTHTETETDPSVVSSLVPLSMADARESRYSDSSFLYSLISMAQIQKEARDTIASVKQGETESLYLDPDNIARVVPGSITDVRFFPSSNVKMVAAASNIGNIGFWNVGHVGFLFLKR